MARFGQISFLNDLRVRVVHLSRLNALSIVYSGVVVPLRERERMIKFKIKRLSRKFREF